MSDVRRKHELLRDECQRRADAAWRRAMRSDISETERRDALDQSHALMVASLMHAKTVEAAADVYPVKFTRQNAGPQSKTAARLKFVKAIAKQCEGAKRQKLALTVWADPEACQHFETFDAVYNFLGRPELF